MGRIVVKHVLCVVIVIVHLLSPRGLVFIPVLDADVSVYTSAVDESETELHREALLISPLH